MTARISLQFSNDILLLDIYLRTDLMLISNNSSGYWIPILIILFRSYSWEYVVYIGFICYVICGQNGQIMKRQLMVIFIIASIALHALIVATKYSSLAVF